MPIAVHEGDTPDKARNQVPDLVLVDVNDRIAVITLNRPEARNALSALMLTQLAEHMSQLDAQADVDVLVLTGAGRAFCTGLDLKEMAASGANIRPADGRPWPQL
ncbi:MAG TPA: enoyl-CoA hydratase-related protein, partial [Acidimicrobiales bacterium]|nr:enoyl-CoA hydratase-related protein [Acidimicrobiales bacterium]